MQPNGHPQPREEGKFPVLVTVELIGRKHVMGLSRSLFLPFAPVEGQHLSGILRNPEIDERIASVTWDIIEQRFHVHLEDCRTPNESLSSLIDGYGPDWELNEPGFFGPDDGKDEEETPP